MLGVDAMAWLRMTLYAVLVLVQPSAQATSSACGNSARGSKRTRQLGAPAVVPDLVQAATNRSVVTESLSAEAGGAGKTEVVISS